MANSAGSFKGVRTEPVHRMQQQGAPRHCWHGLLTWKLTHGKLVEEGWE